MKSNLFSKKRYSIYSTRISLLAFYICFSILNTGCQNNSNSEKGNCSVNEDSEKNFTTNSNTLRPNLDKKYNKDNPLTDDYTDNSTTNNSSDNSNTFTQQDSIEFFKRFSPKTQTFVIDYNKDQHIFGEKGTHLFVEKNPFIFEDGTPVKSKVNLEMKEFYDKKTMLLAGLATQTANGFLESGGMLHLQATAEGKKVKLKKEIAIEMPTMNTKVSSQENMKVYSASNNVNSSLDRNSSSNPPTTWQTNGKAIRTQLPLQGYLKWDYMGNMIHKNYLTKDSICHCADASIVYEKVEPLSEAISYKKEFTFPDKTYIFPSSQTNREKIPKLKRGKYYLESPKNMQVVGSPTHIVYDFYPLSEDNLYYYDTMRVAFEIDKFRTGSVVERMESTHNALKSYTTQTSIRPNSGIFLT